MAVDHARRAGDVTGISRTNYRGNRNTADDAKD
jgi:hypothetical protein